MGSPVTTDASVRATGAREQRGPLVGTGVLLRFALRRDRVRLPVWVLAIGLTVVATAATFPELYATAEDRQARASLMTNPAAIAMGGPRIGIEDYTFGAMLTNEMLGFTAVIVGLMSLLLVVRHTRADEEAGRTELVRASVVGRHAPLAAGLALVGVACLALAVLTAAGLGALGLESVDWAGSWLFAAAIASVGLVLAGVAAVTAQVSQHARGASGLAGLVLGVTYALRVVGDVGTDWLSWLSPIGWAQRTFAYVDDRWWPLLLALATTVALVAVAIGLGERRDVGAGLRPPRPGRAHASAALASPLTLALRLQRGSLIAWTVSFLGFGLLFGTLLADIEGFVAEMDVVTDQLLPELGDQLLDGFLALIVSLLAITAAIHAILAVLRARAEEAAGLAEPVLATATSRTRWLASHVTIAAVGSVVMLLAGALGVGISGALTTSDSGIVASVLTASLVQIAPLLLTVALTVALVGLAPAASGAAWIVVIYAFAVGILGGLLGLPDWASELSPFSMVPLLPAEPFTAGAVLALLVATAALLVAGFVGFRRRDLATGA